MEAALSLYWADLISIKLEEQMEDRELDTSSGMNTKASRRSASRKVRRLSVPFGDALRVYSPKQKGILALRKQAGTDAFTRSGQ